MSWRLTTLKRRVHASVHAPGPGRRVQTAAQKNSPL